MRLRPRRVLDSELLNFKRSAPHKLKNSHQNTSKNAKKPRASSVKNRTFFRVEVTQASPKIREFFETANRPKIHRNASDSTQNTCLCVFFIPVSHLSCLISFYRPFKNATHSRYSEAPFSSQNVDLIKSGQFLKVLQEIFGNLRPHRRKKASFALVKLKLFKSQLYEHARTPRFRRWIANFVVLSTKTKQMEM